MQKIYILFLALFLGIMSFYLATHQAKNWDIEAYMGIVLHAENPEMPVEKIHKKVYVELRQRNPEAFKSIDKNQDEYYSALAKHPEMYEEELQLFTVKPFYNFVNFTFYKFGATPAEATFFTNIFSYNLLLIFVFFFFRKVLQNDGYAFAVTLCTGIFRPVLDAARQSTPDMLGTLLLLLSLYFLIFRKRYLAFTVTAVCAIFTRPEFAVFYGLIFFVILVLFKKNFSSRDFYFSFGYCFAAFGLVQFFNQISWKTLVMNQFLKFQFFPVTKPDVFLWSDYLGLLKSTFLLEFNNSLFAVLLFISVIVFGKNFSIGRLFSQKFYPFYVAIAVVFTFAIIRFFLFPTFVSRMMCPFYLIIIFTLAIYLSRKKIRHIR